MKRKPKKDAKTFKCGGDVQHVLGLNADVTQKLTERNMIILNVTEQPTKKVHLAYYTVRDGDQISLKEVYEAYYPHPQAPGAAVVSRIEIRMVKKALCPSTEAAPLVLLENAQFNIGRCHERQETSES
jgi:hypothetical protein